jgi:subfamily B ATP-binding cassette protein MsbA
MDMFKRLLLLAKPHMPRFLIAMVCMMGVGGLTATQAYLVKPVLDGIFVNKDYELLKWLSLVILILYAFKGIFSYGHTVLMNYIGLRIIADLRNRLYRKIQEQSLTFFTKNPTGILMARITNDVGSIQGAVSEAVTSLLKDTFTLIGLIFVIFYQSWKLALVALVVFPLIIYPIATFGRKMRRIATRTQVTVGSLTSLLQETISGTRIVKAFSMEEYENQRFEKENENLLRLTLKSVTISAISSPFMEFLGGCAIAIIIFYGGLQVISGSFTPGRFFSFLTALILLYEPVKRLTNVNNTIQQGIAGAQRVFHIIDMVPDIRDNEQAVPLPRIAKGITVRNVSFRYEETPVLKNVSLDIKAGEVIAFVGMSGGGKTTMVNLIPRFYDVSEGSILIDDHDIRSVTVGSLRGQIGIVTQQTILFNDTVRNNIAYGDRGKSDDEIISAAKAANAHGFIMSLPEGYNTMIGEQGAKLSGGERQRISIARALLKDAPILILDEATSSLDTEAELEVQDALENLMKGRTTLMIAHRLSTIRNADRIIVLVNGEIVEEGNHEALIEKKGEYFRLYNMQFADKFAANGGPGESSTNNGR